MLHLSHLQDFSKPDSITQCARNLEEELEARKERLDCLINNAGSFSMQDTSKATLNGNIIGHVALTRALLLSSMQQQHRFPRIVNVSSGMHILAKRMNKKALLEDILRGKNVDSFRTYVLSKWLLVYFGDYLQDKQRVANFLLPGDEPSHVREQVMKSEIDVVSIHPGTVLTFAIKGLLNIDSNLVLEGQRRTLKTRAWQNMTKTFAHKMLESICFCRRNRRRSALCVANAATMHLDDSPGKQSARSKRSCYFSGMRPRGATVARPSLI